MKRFWSKVRKTSGCWLWVGAHQPGKWPYGQLGFRGKVQAAHRVSWILHHGKIPEGLLVCHSCDNPSCVHPGHLFLGTAKYNKQDCLAKGRQGRGYRQSDESVAKRVASRRANPEAVRHGERSGNARLTFAEAEEIRRRHSLGESLNELARAFSVSKSTAGNAARRATYTRG